MLHVEIDRCCPQAWSVLHMRRHRLGKCRRGGAAAMVAAVGHGAMLGDFQVRLRQVEHLTALLPRDHRVRQACLAVPAGGGGVALDTVWLVGRAQGVAMVARLAAALLA